MAAVCKLRIPCKRFLILLSHCSLACKDSQSKPPNANVQPRTRVSFNSVLLNLKCVALLSKGALSCCEWHHLSLVRSVGNATLFSQCSKISFKSSVYDGFSQTTSLPKCCVSQVEQRDDNCLKKSTVKPRLCSERADLHRWRCTVMLGGRRVVRPEHEGYVALIFPYSFQGSRMGRIYKGVEHRVAQQSWTGDWEGRHSQETVIN